ncbi:MAG: hypothetical protein IPO23_07795 [Flavobacterium sp.]|jgi:micrococcal nuclease|nr:hypothetical protein [Flavobacterium sp.]
MRLFQTISGLCFIVFGSFCLNAQTVTLDNITTFENQRVTLCEKVIGTYQSKSESGVSYLNFGAPYPNHSFTVVIFKKDLEHFDYDPVAFLKNKTVCVSGTIVFYKNKPQIIASNPDQIVVKEN